MELIFFFFFKWVVENDVVSGVGYELRMRSTDNQIGIFSGSSLSFSFSFFLV